jgi:hypothetical protein
VKQNESSTKVLILQVEKLIEHKNKESIHQDSISDNTSEEALMLMQGVCILDEIKKRVFEYSKVQQRMKDY